MTTKITISGTPRKFDQAELEQRQAGFHNVYIQTDQCCEIARGDIPSVFLAKVIEMHDAGYKLSNRYPVSIGEMSYQCRMVKPLELQQADLAVIDEKVKQDYIKELEAEHQQYKELLTEQLLQAAALKAQKKIDDAKAKLLAEVQAEVANVFKPLVIPD